MATPEEAWTRTYQNIPVPEYDPCDGCRLADTCDTICPARAKWWDHCVRGMPSEPPRGKGRPGGTGITRYTVYRGDTNELVAKNASPAEAAKAMGISRGSFYSTITKVRAGHVTKWKIYSEEVGSSDHKRKDP